MVHASSIVDMHGIYQQTAVHVAKIPHTQYAAVVVKTDRFTVTQVHVNGILDVVRGVDLQRQNKGLRTVVLIRNRHRYFVIADWANHRRGVFGRVGQYQRRVCRPLIGQYLAGVVVFQPQQNVCIGAAHVR